MYLLLWSGCFIAKNMFAIQIHRKLTIIWRRGKALALIIDGILTFLFTSSSHLVNLQYDIDFEIYFGNF